MAARQKRPSPGTVETESFRRFNRMYTRFIGTLNEGLLRSQYSLAEVRVLYEVSTRSAPAPSEIAETLGLDPGYLSRLLRKLEGDGLLSKTTSKKDGRYSELILTARGKAAFKRLDALSNEQASAVLSDLAPEAQQELIHCMRSIERVLAPSDRGPAAYILRPHGVGDMGWIAYRESVGYAGQYGWDATFEALVMKIVQEFVTNFDPIRERCWIAEVDGHNVGHIFLVEHPARPGTAKLRLLFVEQSARGIGLGGALVGECIRFARAAGYRRVVLWTQSILTAAHRLYERAGFRLVKEEPHHSFGHDLIGQEWELELN